MMRAILIGQVLSCWFMLGLIWIVQIIHYPAFKDIAHARFVAFHGAHSRALSFLAGPMMLLEIVTAIMLVATEPGWFWFLNAILVGVSWLMTFLVSVPLHNKLSLEKNSDAIQRLIKTNWPRTLIWSFRSVALAYFLFRL